MADQKERYNKAVEYTNDLLGPEVVKDFESKFTVDDWTAPNLHYFRMGYLCGDKRKTIELLSKEESND